MSDDRRVLPAEQGLGCIGGALAVPTLLPMAVLIGALMKGNRSSPFVRKLIRIVAMPLLFILFMLAAALFAPYYLLLKLLAKAGLVRMQLPASLTVVHRAPDLCVLQLMAPQEDRDTAASMLHELVARIAAAAGTDPEEARHKIDRVAQYTEYGKSDELKLNFGELATLEAQVYVDQGSFNADITVRGDERCVSAAG